MGRKGKKKPQSTDKEAASTSKATSSEQPQEKQEEAQKKQVAQSVPQKQQVPPGPSPQQPQSQPQGAWGQRQQQQQQVAPSSSQQHPQRVSSQPQQQVTQQPQSQPQGAWGQRQQQQQQVAPSSSQQHPQRVSSQPQQQVTRGPQQQPTQVPQQPKTQGPIPQQQQGAWGGRPQQQQQGAWGRPQQQQQQGAWGRPQQQQQSTQPRTQGPQQPQQQQGAWGRPQQGATGPPPQQQRGPPPQQQRGPPPQQQRGPPPQQQWGPPPPQQQGTWSSPPPQQQGAWGQQQQPRSLHTHQQGPLGQPQQLQTQGPIPQQQQQAAWSQSLQPGAQGSQPQQQKARGQPQLQQQSVDIGAAGDSKLVTGKGSVMRSDTQQPQQSTSAQFERDTSRSTKTTQIGKLSSTALKQYQLSIPKRKDPMKAGTKGTPIRVYTNLFEIIFDKNFETNAVHYDVTITPIASKSLYRQVFEQCRVNNFQNRYPAFDGKKNAYSANDLPFDDSMETEIEIYDKEREIQRKFKISLTKVANIDLGWIKNLRPGLDEADRDQTGIQVLDIIMRHAPESRFLSVGRSLFWNVDNSELLGGGLSLSRGGFTSAILGWKPYINIDVSHKGFPTCQNVVNLMGELTNPRGYAAGNDPNPDEVNKSWNRDKIARYLKGLRVIYQIPNQPRTKRTYRINGIGPTAYQHRFDCEGNMITVDEYFTRVKNHQLRFPDLPCLWAGATNRPEKIYLPPELCTIVAGQNVNRKLDEMQTTSMIKYAATSAPVRKDKIKDAFTKIDVNDSNTMKHEFHLSVRSEMKQVAARILPAPELQYNERVVRVSRGIWNIQPFQHACNLEKGTWTVLDLCGAVVGMIHDFVTSLKQCARDVGMCIEDPQTPYKSLRSQNLHEIKSYFRSKKGLKLIIVIIPDRTDATYGKVKQITEIDEGILTQCVKFMTVRKNSFSAVKNILLKINSKLNGVNHTLNSRSIPFCLKNNDFMLVGADVTHPSPDATDIPSIAAVSASSNSSAFQYNIALRLQPPKQEMILDLEEIIIAQLQIYKKQTSRLPNKIIYYRDGVSEGQLAQVMHFELNAIKRACKRSKADNIQVTCLVVQKRHHVRLFPARDVESDDKNRNVRAGTIVDTEITHPNHIDFYLVSHASIQGTARPTKYRCICNESDFTEDHIEEMTYYLCHMYARCTRAVSYPAPTYYAHLGAYRGRALIQGIQINLKDLDREQAKLCMKMDQSPMCFV